MLKAGADALDEHRSLDNYGLVAEIYRAMVRAALRTERSARPPHLLDDERDEE